jgi:hypothetical protein
MLMLIDTRPQPEPAPEPIEVDWRLCFWIALTLALFVGAGSVPPLLGVVLAIAGVCTTGKVLLVGTATDGRGLRDWRQ